jgi:TRAP-type C4-dicarboxylate transport system permease small subunit
LRWLDQRLEFTLAFLFYFYLTSIMFIEVIRRYAFNASSSWGTETAIYAFIWMTYIAAAKGVKERSHLSVSILVDRFGRRGKFATAMLSDVCFLILAVVILYYSSVAVLQSAELGQNMQGADLPIWLASVSVPFGWFLVSIRVVQRSVGTIKSYLSGQSITTSDSDIAE